MLQRKYESISLAITALMCRFRVTQPLIHNDAATCNSRAIVDRLAQAHALLQWKQDACLAGAGSRRALDVTKRSRLLNEIASQPSLGCECADCVSTPGSFRPGGGTQST